MFSDFVNKAIKQDSRNQFDSFDGDVCFIPETMRALYKEYNPVDVEVKINNVYVRFFPVEELTNLQDEYRLGEKCFVFASCNGEPIYLKADKVYTCLFSKKGIIEEVLSDSLNEYLGKIN